MNLQQSIRSILEDCPRFFDFKNRPNRKASPMAGRFAIRKLDTPGRGRIYGKPLTPWMPFWNGNTYLGLNYLLDAGFGGSSQSTNWYGGLINTGGVLSVNDTSASHAGWTEITNYTSGTRIAWASTAAASGVRSAPVMTYTAGGTIDVLGAFLANSSTKSSVVDLIYATAVNAVAQTFLITQQVQVYYAAAIDPG
jgi:hypothetical protein